MKEKIKKKQATTIVENIKKEGQKFIAIIEPIEIENEIISKAIIPQNIDVEVEDAVVIEKKQERFVIKEVLLNSLEDETEEEEEETKPLALEEIEKEPHIYYETRERETVDESKTKNIFKKFLKGLGLGGLVIGGGFLYISFAILLFLFVAFVGLLTIVRAISLFLEGSIIWGLAVLFIVTPIAIAIASYAFVFLFPLAILVVIIWGAIQLFGGDISFWSIWDVIWLIIKVLILGGVAFFGVSSFIRAVKNKNILSSFKENWFYILLFFFLFWLFFL